MNKKNAKTKRNAPSKKKSMTGDNDLLKIAARLKDQVRKADAGPDWRDRVNAALVDPDKNKGRIRAVQIIRDAGGMNADDAFFQLILFADRIAEDRRNTDAELNRIWKKKEVADKSYGLKDDEEWPDGEAPEEVEKLKAAWDLRYNVIMANVLREHGEDEMADLLLADPDAFYDRMEIGRFNMYGTTLKELKKNSKPYTTGACK